jgi:serine/threonine-protein kinase SRPK3
MNTPQTVPLSWANSDLSLEPSPHRPTYTVFGTLSSRMTAACFVDPHNVRVKLCDFGEAFFVENLSSSIARRLHTPPMYASPEVLLRQPVGPPADVWAVGIIVHDLISGGWPLFARVWETKNDHVLAGIVLRLGKLPDHLWSLWEARSEYFDDVGAWIGKREQRPYNEDDEGNLISSKVVPERCGCDVRTFAEVIQQLNEPDVFRRATIEDAVAVLSRLWLRPSAPTSG